MSKAPAPLSAPGIELSKEQRERILKLVRSGKLLEAQRIILDYLNQRFEIPAATEEP